MQPREQFRGTPSSLCFPFLPFLELPRSAAPKGEALGTGKGAHTKGTAGPAKTGQQGSAAKLNVEQVSTAPALKSTHGVNGVFLLSINRKDKAVSLYMARTAFAVLPQSFANCPALLQYSLWSSLVILTF